MSEGTGQKRDNEGGQEPGKQLDGSGDFILDREYIPQLPIVILGPQVIAILDGHELGSHPEPFLDAANAAFQHRPYSQLLPNLPYVLRLPFEVEGGCTSCNAKALHLSEGVNEFLGHPVAEVFLILVRAHIHEWENGDGLALL